MGDPREASTSRRDVSEEALAAFADGRLDLVDRATRERLEVDEELRATCERLQAESRALSVALRAAEPRLSALDEDEVADLVATAMRRVDEPEPLVVPMRSFGWGVLVGGLAIVVAAAIRMALWEVSNSPVADASAAARTAWSVFKTLDRIVAVLPGGWTLVAAVSSFVAGVSSWSLARLTRGHVVAALTSALCALWLVSTSSRAHAYEVEGAWPTPDPTVLVDVEQQPLPQALEAVARSAGLGLVYRLEDNRTVTLHARGVPLREVLDAVLDGVPAVVRRTEHFLIVDSPRAASIAPHGAPRPPSSSLVREPTSRPTTGASTERIDDLVTFGSDAHVPTGHDVRDVVTMGGDVRIDGRALGNVLTMGGDADVAGVVVGDVVTMGGDIRIRPGGVVHGGLRTLGGEVLREGQAPRDEQVSLGPAALATAAGLSVLAEASEAALRYALVFVAALLLAFFAPERFGRMHRAVQRAPLRSFAAGVVGLVAVAFTSVVLVVTVVGIPVAFVLGVLVLVGAFAGLATVGLLVGQALPVAALATRPVWRLAAGVLVLFLVTRVPFFGWLAFLAALALGFGAFALTRFGKRDVAPES